MNKSTNVANKVGTIHNSRGKDKSTCLMLYAVSCETTAMLYHGNSIISKLWVDPELAHIPIEVLYP